MKNDRRPYLYEEVLIYLILAGLLSGIWGLVYSSIIGKLLISNELVIVSIACGGWSICGIIGMYIICPNISIFRFFKKQV
jgi:hypothetical protein